MLRKGKMFKHWLLLLTSLIVFSCVWLESNAEKDKCEELITDPTNFTIIFDNDGNAGKGIMSLLGLVLKYDFGKGILRQLSIRDETLWRLPLVKTLGEISMQVCPHEHVPSEFINTLMNFILIYYNNGVEREKSPTRVSEWNQILKDLEHCKGITAPLVLRSRGGLVNEFVKGEGDKEKITRISIQEEKADSFKQMDYVMEGLWYMFETTAGICYETAEGSKSSWLANYFLKFREDFTEQFRKWWVNPDPVNYGLLFGDMDLYASLYNLRSCAVAAFQTLDILDRLPLRPVNIDETNQILNDLNTRKNKE